jgi:hypothetical protein
MEQLIGGRGRLTAIRVMQRKTLSDGEIFDRSERLRIDSLDPSKRWGIPEI